MKKLRALTILAALGTSLLTAGCGDGCEHHNISIPETGYYESYSICTDEQGNRTIESN